MSGNADRTHKDTLRRVMLWLAAISGLLFLTVQGIEFISGEPSTALLNLLFVLMLAGSAIVAVVGLMRRWHPLAALGIAGVIAVELWHARIASLGVRAPFQFVEDFLVVGFIAVLLEPLRRGRHG